VINQGDGMTETEKRAVREAGHAEDMMSVRGALGAQAYALVVIGAAIMALLVLGVLKLLGVL
jgi:hypothetical protein